MSIQRVLNQPQLMSRNRHKNKPKASSYSPNSIGGMVDVLEIKKKFHDSLKNDKKDSKKSIQGEREKE